MDLDSGATCNFITEKQAQACNLIVKPNSQAAKLGDGDTTIKSSGEIDTILYRNEVPLRYRALVCNTLHHPIIGGIPFFKDNGIKQDFSNNTISLLYDRCTIPATTLEATLPVSTQHGKQTNGNHKLISLKINQIIQPGDSMEIPVNIPDQTLLAEGFRPTDWPPPQIT